MNFFFEFIRVVRERRGEERRGEESALELGAMTDRWAFVGCA